MIKSFLLLSVILACGNAEITLQDIDSKPSSRAKNFMIWQYLKQNITAKQADAAYTQVEGSVA
ncbi:MAG: lytic transglycosylase domain-containing protein, partial [Sulfurimonas sp.]|nr:lytic transglycosylase domain-containing protein [Sulfurimonas sp.]